MSLKRRVWQIRTSLMGLLKRTNRKTKKALERDYSKYEPVDLGKEITERFLPVLASFDDNDIYAISFYVEHEDDDPRKPLVYFGYNTEAQVKNEMENAADEEEARWNFAFWLQNELYCFGADDDTADLCRAWAYQQNLAADETSYQVFVNVLIDVVKDLQQSGVIAKKIGKRIPVIIHELEYYTQIAQQNIEANGADLISAEFLHFCGG
jgi:hypothetical protein